MRLIRILTVLALVLVSSPGEATSGTPADGYRWLMAEITARREDRSGITSGVVGSVPRGITSQLPTLAPPLIRLEFPITARAADIAPYVDAYAQQGSRLLLLAGFPTQGLPTADQARGLAGWATAFGPASGIPAPIVAIEFGSETSYAYQHGDKPGDPSYTQRARNYAVLATIAAGAIRTADPGVGLLVQADDGDTGRADWVDAMFAAAPDLSSHVLGWSLHPYGPDYDARLKRTRTQLSRHDAHQPLWITEWGLATDSGRCLDDNYGWNPCMNDMQAATTLLRVVADLPRYDVAAFMIYQDRDQRDSGFDTDKEHYFGLLRNHGEPKGPYTQAAMALWGK